MKGPRFHSSAWPHLVDRKLTRDAPCFTGLTGGYCRHWLHRLFRPFTFNPQNRLPLSFLADYSAAAEAEGEACAEADASGEASGAGDGEGGAVVPGVSSERISPSCTVML